MVKRNPHHLAQAARSRPAECAEQLLGGDPRHGRDQCVQAGLFAPHLLLPVNMVGTVMNGIESHTQIPSRNHPFPADPYTFRNTIVRVDCVYFLPVPRVRA